MQEDLKFTQALHRRQIESRLNLLKNEAERLLGLSLKIRYSLAPSKRGFAMVVEKQQSFLERFNPFSEKRRVFSVAVRYNRDIPEITFISYALEPKGLDELIKESSLKISQSIRTPYSYFQYAAFL